MGAIVGGGGGARCRVLHPRSPGLPAASSLAGWAADHSRDADGRRPGPIPPFRRGRRSHRDRARRRRRCAGLHQSVGRDAGSASEWCTRNCSAGPSGLTSTTRQALPRPGTRAPSSLSARSPEPDQGRPGKTRSNDSLRAGREWSPPDSVIGRLTAAASYDADVFRVLMETVLYLALPEEVIERPGMREEIEQSGCHSPPPAPARTPAGRGRRFRGVP